jgi:hypothetical protein
VGALGAALANLAFYLQGTHMIEVFSPRYFNACHRNFAIAAGFLPGVVIGNGKDWELCLRVDEVSAPIITSWGLVKEGLGMLKSSFVSYHSCKTRPCKWKSLYNSAAGEVNPAIERHTNVQPCEKVQQNFFLQRRGFLWEPSS